MSGAINNWLVIFSDDPQMLERRNTHGKQHLEYLSKNSEKIRMAGGLRHLPDTSFTGGAWVVNAAEKGEVEELVKSDPYYDAMHRKYDISYWGIAHNSM